MTQHRSELTSSRAQISKITGTFDKTAGVFNSSLARRFICRLNESKIPHMAVPCDEELIRILVQSCHLSQAIDLQPQQVVCDDLRNKHTSIPNRLLISIPAGAFLGATLSLFLPLNQGVMAMAGTVFLVLMSEACMATIKARRLAQ